MSNTKNPGIWGGRISVVTVWGIVQPLNEDVTETIQATEVQERRLCTGTRLEILSLAIGQNEYM
jgi:hypothetical protein